jgi:hypothetical protein
LLRKLKRVVATVEADAELSRVRLAVLSADHSSDLPKCIHHIGSFPAGCDARNFAL